jgi:hypothetical protein
MVGVWEEVVLERADTRESAALESFDMLDRFKGGLLGMNERGEG